MKYVYYHANCYDGFGAAWAARHALGEKDVHYVPANYGQPIVYPDLIEGDVNELYFVDYSRPRAELEMLKEAGWNVIVIDHHQTAEKDLEGFEGATFDSSKSGATLTWRHFYPRKKMPQLLAHIEDRDLWKFELDHTAEIHAGLCAHTFDFEVWDELAEDLASLVEIGQVILDYHEILVDRFNEEVDLQTIAGHEVPIVNVSLLFSEVPHDLLRKFPGAPFAAYRYEKRGGVVQYGLRSRKADEEWPEGSVLDFDVSEVAKEYGGGGHKHAAGFRLDSVRVGVQDGHGPVTFDVKPFGDATPVGTTAFTPPPGNTPTKPDSHGDRQHFPAKSLS